MRLALRRILLLAVPTTVVALVSLRPLRADDDGAAAEPVAATPGVISGRVRFKGEAPPPGPIHAHHDPEVCGKGGVIADETLVVAVDGGLANVVVVLDGVPAGAPEPGGAAALDQRSCAFVPHVQTVTHGATLSITSNDPVLHNVHAFLGQRTAFNLAIPVAGKVVARRLGEPGILRIRCDSGHTWMSAFIAVVPHRWHATSAADGSFTIGDVPPGTYTVRAWHERLGAVQQSVTVTAGGTITTSLTFELPTDPTAPAPTDPTGGLRDALRETRTAVDALDQQRRADERDRLAGEGRPLFRKYCATCHGQAGDGRGPSARFTSTPPRDFTRGTYKFRMTPAGSPPTREDLVRTISVGVRGTHMPAWSGRLTSSQIRTLARYLTTRSEVFWTGTALPAPIDIPAEPALDDASVARGRALYEKMGCFACHGLRGTGDGPAASALRDDWGRLVPPADLTRGVYKGGVGGAVVYRAISTGLGGTPMPSFDPAMTPSERWDLAHYVVSLARGRTVVDYLLDPVGRSTPP